MPEPKATGFLPIWLAMAGMGFLLAGGIVLCLVWPNEIRQLGWQLPEAQREFWRTIFYAAIIALFPLSNLVRFVLLRLNQTMPGDDASGTRYTTTVLIALAMVEPAGLFGVLMFAWGDGLNTLYIFAGLAALGFVIHRPKPGEYRSILEARAAKAEGGD